MFPTIERIAQSVEVIISVLSIVINVILLYIIARHTPRRMHTFSVILLNTAISDLVISLCAFMTNNRIIPSGQSMIFVSYGPCKFIGAEACLAFHKVLVHALIHGVMSQFVAFSYRYYILVNTATPTRMRLIVIVLLVYLPSLALLIFHLPESAYAEELISSLRIHHPSYNVSGLTISGYADITNVSTLTTYLLLILPNIPLYLVMCVIKRRINSILENKRLRLRRTSRIVHKQLLMMLCLQSYMPLLLLVTMILHLLGHFEVYSHPMIEYLTMTAADLLPLGSCIITIRYISPYRKAFARMFWLHRKQPDRYTSIQHPVTSSQSMSLSQPASAVTIPLTNTTTT